MRQLLPACHVTWPFHAATETATDRKPLLLSLYYLLVNDLLLAGCLPNGV